MKYISKITLGLGLFVSLLSSCKDDNGLNNVKGISLDKEEIAIGPDGGVENVVVSSGMEWVSSSSQPWIAVSPANGFGSVEGTLAIDSTLEVSARTAQVRFRQSDNQEQILKVVQFGYGKQIIPSEKEISVKSSDVYDNRYFDLTVSTNVNFKVDSDIIYELEGEVSDEDSQNMTEGDTKNWIIAPEVDDLTDEFDRKDRPRTFKIRFRWEMNTIPYKRVAKIKLVPVNSEDQLVDQDGNPTGEVIVTVIQESAVRITDDRRGDSIAVIMMNEKIQSMVAYDFSENMNNWECVTLWEEGDKEIPSEDAVGRVRRLSLLWFDLKEGETLPKEIKYLKYMEEFDIRSNTNRQVKEMELGDEICELEHLKKLTVYSYGLTKLPENFAKLGKKLEYLDLSSNNFDDLSDIIDVVNSTNFPKLRGLELSGNRRNDTTVELAGANLNDLGLHIDLNGADKDKFIKLLSWDGLEYLGLSYMLIEGQLPTDEEMMNKFGKYTQDDFYEGDYQYDKLSSDTCGWLKTDREVIFKGMDNVEVKVKGQDVARVLPKARQFSINLNYITGKLPNWILFHPYFYNWGPEGMIINQWEKGKDSKGQNVGFSNISLTPDFTYYFGNVDSGEGSAYPLYFNKYVGGRPE